MVKTKVQLFVIYLSFSMLIIFILLYTYILQQEMTRNELERPETIQNDTK